MATQPDHQSFEILITQRVRDEYSVSASAPLTPETSLLDTGIIDSSGYLSLFSWLEEEFDVRVADAEMVPSNFESIGRIAAYLRRKLGAIPTP